MRNYNTENEKVKRRYLSYLKEAQRMSEASLDGVAKALATYEAFTDYKDFKLFSSHLAMAFKKHITTQKSGVTGKPLSQSTLHVMTTNLRRFFHWLAGQSGYKSRLTYSDAEYFNLSNNDVRIATAKRSQKAPTLEQVYHVLRAMPSEGEIALRNRALVAFITLTGARDSAVASIKLKHLDWEAGGVFQDAREVNTKFRKTSYVYFFPVEPFCLVWLREWADYLTREKLWGLDDPLFPATLVKRGQSKRFEVMGVDRKPWANANAIRAIFKEAFEATGLPYFNPHSFRHMLARLGQQLCKTPEDYKAWSQNLGHENVMTTFSSYGEVPEDRQQQIIKRLASANAGAPDVSPEFEQMLRVTLLKMTRNQDDGSGEKG